MHTIAEKLAAEVAASQDPGVFTVGIRAALGWLIAQKINELSFKIPLIIIDRSLERLLQYTQRA